MSSSSGRLKFKKYAWELEEKIETNLKVKKKAETSKSAYK